MPHSPPAHNAYSQDKIIAEVIAHKNVRANLSNIKQPYYEDMPPEGEGEGEHHIRSTRTSLAGARASMI